MKLSTAQKKLDKIKAEIKAAEEFLVKSDEQAEFLDKQIAAALSKSDQELTEELEKSRAMLNEERELFKNRIKALKGTLPEAEKAVERATLAAALKEHTKAVEQINAALETWRERAKSVNYLEEAAQDVVEARRELKEIVSKIHYFEALLDTERHELVQPDHLSRAEIQGIRDMVRRACNTELDPHSKSIWDEKLDALREAKREEERARVRAEHRGEAARAGW